jgi:hypothetical protein
VNLDWIFFFFKYDIQHCFICRRSDFTVAEDLIVKFLAKDMIDGLLSSDD